ncbi:MAG: hypothetical protein E7596_00280 [Ruminococcaceae bacterium]|nr:hypothetical protein [Oscillospiraceae bacterium]
MKIGEIKAQAIMLMYPDVSISFDEEDEKDVERAIYELKLNPNFEGVLRFCIGSINRALSYVEGQGFAETKCVDISSADCQRTNDGRAVLPMPNDVFSIERVLCHAGGKAYELCFEVRGNEIISDYKSDTYTVIYKVKAERITSATPDSYKLNVSDSIAEAIPYFVAAELFKQENSQASQGYFDYFEDSIKRIGEMKAPCHQCFETIYSME